jgi:hypothetical protein
VSGCLLIYAMCKIVKFIRKGLKSPQLDKTALLLHSSAFGLYMVSVVVLYTAQTLFFFMENQSDPKAQDIYFSSAIFTIICSFTSQLLLCAIFWRLGNPIETESHHSMSVHSVESHSNTDRETSQNNQDSFATQTKSEQHAAMQARIWNQFMNVNQSGSFDVNCLASTELLRAPESN